MKPLVVYYSRTGNTKFVAELVAGHLGADIEEIIDENDRKGLLGWLRAGKDATLRKETKISPVKHDPRGCGLIIIGCPVWNRRLPPAIRTYLRKHDISDKKVAFFNTNSSNEAMNTLEEMKGLIKKEPVSQMVFSRVNKNRGETEVKIKTWCDELKKLAQR